MTKLEKVEQRSRLRRLVIDVLGVLIIIGAGITGPLPGPGGIPLLILGLSMLATNHEWAERLLDMVKKHRGNMASKLFSDKPAVRLVIDLVAVLFIAFAVILLNWFTHNIARSAAVSLTIAGLILFFGNRQRATKIKHIFRGYKRK